MATNKTRATTPSPDGPRETAEQTGAPLGANVDEASVPEVRERMAATDTEDEPTEEAPSEWVVLADAQHYEERIISPYDWRKVGVEDAPTVSWNTSNGHRVKKSELSFLDEDQFARFILADPRLRVVTE